MSAANGVGIPDDLRCKRSDGKQWRCTAMSMPDKTVCEKHYIQAKRRSVKSAQRKSLYESNNYLEGQDDFQMIPITTNGYSSKEKRHKRQIQYSPESETPPNCMDLSESDVKSNDESSSPINVGMFEETYRSYKTPMDCFRNRSHESMSPMEESDANTDASAESVEQTCHHCGLNDGDSFISCLRCNQRAFCKTCITTWYPEISHEEVEKKCPACRGLCDCEPCLRSDNSVKVWIQEIPILDKLQYLYRILSAVLPVIKQIHRDQSAEVELEKKLRGTEMDLVRARLKADEQMCCNICRIPVVDYYRHCFVCSYDLCLRCCQDIRAESSVEISEMSPHTRDGVGVQNLKLNFSDKFPKWKANSDGSIPCPPKEYGGCGFRFLSLSRIFKMNWVAKLVKNAEEMVNGCKVLDTGDLGEVSESRDNFLYIPSLETIKSEGVRGFEKHLGEGRVAVVRRVLDESSFHRWDLEVMWKDIVKISDEQPKEEDSLVNAIDCLDGSEVDVRLSEFMKVYKEGRSRENGLPLLWKLKDWPNLSASEEFVFYKRPDFVRRLPLLEYIHPRLGVLNVAAKLPLYSLQNDSGPKICISCGSYEELGQGDSVTHLHYNMRDMVYLLVHTYEGKVDAPRERKLVEETDLLDDHKMESSCMDYGGARWDIFRRQDHSKLAEYLKVHMSTFKKTEYLEDDFASCSLYEGHYLNEDHKRQLKEEFGVEPWSFEQHRGEAIFIPAGSPFQVRNLQSNIQLAFDFLFPESVGEAVRLAEEIRCLPNNHEFKHQILEVGKISLYAASSAIKEVQKLVLDPKLGAELGFEDPNLTKAVTEKLDNAVKWPQHISCQ